MTTKPWVVVEGASTDNQREVADFYVFNFALAYVHQQFEPDEQAELHVDIMKRLPDGSLTTEY